MIKKQENLCWACCLKMAFCVFRVFLLFPISISCKHNTHRLKSFWFTSCCHRNRVGTQERWWRDAFMLLTGNNLNGTFYPKLREGLRLNTTLTRLCLYCEQVLFDSWGVMLTGCDSFLNRWNMNLKGIKNQRRCTIASLFFFFSFIMTNWDPTHWCADVHTQQ